MLLVLTAACVGRDDASVASRPDPERATAATLSRGSTPGVQWCLGAEDSLVTAAGIGPVRLWMTAERLVIDCAARDTAPPFLAGDGGSERALAVGDAASLVIAVASGSGAEAPIVTRAFTASPRFRTRDGYRVGTTLREVNRGSGEVCLTSVGQGLSISIEGAPGVSMTVALDSLLARDMVTRGALGRIDDTMRVNGILLDGNAPPCKRR